MKNKLITTIILGGSTWLALFIGESIPLLGTSVAAILIGAIIRHTPIYKILNSAIVRFVSSYFLKTGIVFLGFNLTLRIINEVGPIVIVIIIALISVSILTSFLVNKGLKVNSKLSILIGIGTSICGGAAIAATAPIMEAEDEDVAVSVTTMFIYSMLALLFLPVLGKIFGFNDQLYGVLSGVAVNDTASSIATAFSWSDEAGSIATVVKLVRTLFIVPVSIGLICYKYDKQRKSSLSNQTEKVAFKWSEITRIIPKFVILFILAVVFASVVPLPVEVTSIISKLSKIFMTMALFTIGLGVHVKQIKKAGVKPVILGGASWITVLTLSFILIMFLYR